MSIFREKKNLVRLIAFILAAGFAVFAFTYGVVQFAHRDPGYYDVGRTPDADAVAYGSGAHFLWYAEGNSNAIRRGLNTVQKAWSAALIYAYKLLDANTLYENFTNIASLNAAPGQPLTVSEDLFAVLSDAKQRMEEEKAFSLFAGPLFKEWTTLRYLETPEDFDPLRDPDEAELLRAITEMINTPGMFSLELTAPDQATLVISPVWHEFAAGHETEGPVLDLNLMHDAYLLDLIARELKKQGYTKGYLYTDSGCSIWLEEKADSTYTLYRPDGDSVTRDRDIPYPSPSSYCMFTAFPLNEETEGYYQLTENGKTVYRHPFINAATGEPGNLLLSAGIAGGPEDLPDLTAKMIELTAMTAEEDVKAFAEKLPETRRFEYILQQQ